MSSPDIMSAHFLTIVIVTSAMLVTPMYIVCTYHYSGASTRKGVLLGCTVLILGALMSAVTITQVPDRLGAAGALIIPLSWLAPSLFLWIYRDWFLSEPLSQHWLVGLQIWRVIGGVFLIEMSRSNVPAIFAYPAGIGDLMTGVTALLVLIFYGKHKQLPVAAIYLVLVIGVVDFISAFFFGYFSTEGPAQLFFPEVKNDTLLYPTGLIPLFLVPYAIFFHTLSWLSLRKAEAMANVHVEKYQHA